MEPASVMVLLAVESQIPSAGFGTVALTSAYSNVHGLDG